jgi:adenylate kinase family enzyme
MTKNTEFQKNEAPLNQQPNGHQPPLLKSQLARVKVVGSSSAGKAAFSRSLANRLGFHLIDMDAEFEEISWMEPTTHEITNHFTKILNQPHWVLEENYERNTPVDWQRVTTVIWLDYALQDNVFSTMEKAFDRWFLQTTETQVNRQQVGQNKTSIFTHTTKIPNRKSLLLWLLKAHGAKRAQYNSWMNDPRFSHITFIRIESPLDAMKLLDALE